MRKCICIFFFFETKNCSIHTSYRYVFVNLMALKENKYQRNEQLLEDLKLGALHLLKFSYILFYTEEDLFLTCVLVRDLGHG